MICDAQDDHICTSNNGAPMTDKTSILIFAGSTRQDALSGKLAHAVSLEVAGQGGVPKLISLKDFPAPIYNGDDEAENGVPQTIQDLTALIRGHDGVIIATPEYNGFFTPLIKNTLDWCSRPGASTQSPALPRGKPACVVASAPGAIGGIRAIPRLRDYLSELGFLVSPEVLSVSKAGDAFGDDGRLQVEAQADGLKRVVTKFLELSTRARTS